MATTERDQWSINDPDGIADIPDLYKVYLIHFDTPYQHAKHYLGSTKDLRKRLQQHALGTKHGGARLMEVVTMAGISWRVSRLWIGGRLLEAQFKRWNNGCRLCPLCKQKVRG